MTADEVERINRQQYEKGYPYSLSAVMRGGVVDREEYFYKLSRVRVDLIRQIASGKVLLDVGCGAGDYLLAVRDVIARGVGIDLSSTMIREARLACAGSGGAPVDLLQGNALALPFAEGSMEAVFTDSVLVTVPRVEKAIAEIGRVLKSGGKALIGLGNCRSVNEAVCRAYPEAGVMCHVTPGQMRRMLTRSGLEVVGVRTFQILPYWGERPRWIRPLLQPFWKRLMAREWDGKMLDEHLSALPFFRMFAFRYLWICQKRK